MANNKIAIVTGGNRGLGKSMALHLAKQNTNIVALQLNIGNIVCLANFAQTVSTAIQ